MFAAPAKLELMNQPMNGLLNIWMNVLLNQAKVGLLNQPINGSLKQPMNWNKPTNQMKENQPTNR